MGSPRSRLSTGARVALVVIAVLTAFAIFAYQDRLGARAAVGRPAPGFALADQTGRLWRLSALRGHVVVLNFWASWCTVCTAEAPTLQAFARRYRREVTFLGIDWREPEAALRAYVARYGLSYPNLRDGDGSVAQAYGLTGVPETWFIGPHGVARVHIVGAATFAQLQADYRATTGRSIDGLGVGPVPAGARAHALAWDGATLWVAASGGLVAGSGGGRVWRPVAAAALAQGDVRFVVADGPRLYTGGPRVGLWASSDRGAAWRRLTLPPKAGAQPVLHAFAADPTDPARAWAWTSGGLLRTADGGARWTQVPVRTPPPVAPTALGVGGGTLWAATPAGVYRSGDGGRAWRQAPLWQAVSAGTELATPADVLVNRLPLAAAGIAAVGRAVFFAGPSGVWRVAAGGGTPRNAMGGGARAASGAGVGGVLAASPARPFSGVAPGPRGTVWAIAPNGDLYRAAAAGGAWRRWRYPGG